MSNKKFDLIIKNARVVSTSSDEVEVKDIAVHAERIKLVDNNIAIHDANRIIDGEGLLAFPGIIDAHMHCGIYGPLDQDAQSESKAALSGGVTCSLNYMRTGKYYLNEGGSYRNFFPKVLNLSEGNFYTDYSYHLAPLSPDHIDEMEGLLQDFGVASFKIFMFYGGHGLHGTSTSQSDFLMIDKDHHYDLAHFEFVMRKIQDLQEKYPHLSDQISLSMHCETAEIMRAYTSMVQSEGKLSGLKAYSASRPPHSEGLAIFMASYLANETACKNINLLHLSSKKAIDAALMMEDLFPHINFKKELTLGHLLLDYDCEHQNLAKVNPPIRSREDVEYLWTKLSEGHIDWIVSDHACCKREIKLCKENPDDIFLAKSGFGGTEYLLPALISEGSKRGLSYANIARLLSKNPAKRYGIHSKGDIAAGYDADIVLVDPNKSFVVGKNELYSQQQYSPLDGLNLSATVVKTILRGGLAYDQGRIVDRAKGQYLYRNKPANLT